MKRNQDFSNVQHVENRKPCSHPIGIPIHSITQERENVSKEISTHTFVCKILAVHHAVVSRWSPR